MAWTGSVTSADEGDYFDLVVAAERVAGWIETLKAHDVPASRQKQALLQLAEAVEAREAYAEEARNAGAVALLTRMLAKTDDEEVLEAICDIVAGCSGPGATGLKTRTFVYGSGCSVKVVEGSLSDGLGARVWMVAHVLARELIEKPGIVAGCRVLEVGSGVGVTGIVAAKVGARCVTLTDCVPEVLHLLNKSVAANGSLEERAAATPGHPCCSLADASVQGVERQQQQQGRGTQSIFLQTEEADSAGVMDASGGGSHMRRGDDVDDVSDELFDPEDADEVDDVSDALAGLLGGSSSGAGTSKQLQAPEGWDHGNMHVRFLDWELDKAAMQAPGGRGYEPTIRADPAGKPSVASQAAAAAAALEASGGPGRAPEVGQGETFDVIIGTDLIYEMAMAESLPAAIATWLKPGGRCMICNVVREQRLHEGLVANLKAAGMRVHVEQVTPRLDNDGIMGRAAEYEGGFVVFYVDHAHAPAQDWHRHDLFV